MHGDASELIQSVERRSMMVALFQLGNQFPSRGIRADLTSVEIVSIHLDQIAMSAIRTVHSLPSVG
jgi:hypothetical protein